MATNCASATLAGLERDCSTSMGGIITVWIAPYDKVDGKPALDEGQHKISTITMASGDTKFMKYNFRKGTGSMSSSLTVDYTNGVNYVTTDLVLSFLKMETQKRIEISALSKNELAIIVKDANGTLWYLGYDEAVTATAGTGETGTARGDGNKYTITLQDTSVDYPYEVDPTALSTVVNEQ